MRRSIETDLGDTDLCLEGSPDAEDAELGQTSRIESLDQSMRLERLERQMDLVPLGAGGEGGTIGLPG
jgi:hypothetical protein